jgi:hypothetical protein
MLRGRHPSRDPQTLAAAMSGAQVVPIHTATPERYVELFDHVKLRGDGEWWPDLSDKDLVPRTPHDPVVAKERTNQRSERALRPPTLTPMTP